MASLWTTVFIVEPALSDPEQIFAIYAIEFAWGE